LVGCVDTSCAVLLVQEQYIFVYDAILEALKCGDTAVPCTELRQKYARLLKVNPETGKSFCQEEYEVKRCLCWFYCIVRFARYWLWRVRSLVVNEEGMRAVMGDLLWLKSELFVSFSVGWMIGRTSCRLKNMFHLILLFWNKRDMTRREWAKPGFIWKWHYNRDTMM